MAPWPPVLFILYHELMAQWQNTDLPARCLNAQLPVLCKLASPGWLISSSTGYLQLINADTPCCHLFRLVGRGRSSSSSTGLAWHQLLVQCTLAIWGRQSSSSASFTLGIQLTALFFAGWRVGNGQAAHQLAEKHCGPGPPAACGHCRRHV